MTVKRSKHDSAWTVSPSRCIIDVLTANDSKDVLHLLVSLSMPRSRPWWHRERVFRTDKVQKCPHAAYKGITTR